MLETGTELLKRLIETPGVPGREERIRQVLREEVERDGLFDEIRTDALGSLICRRKPAGRRGKARRILLSCHMDEIGFYVRHIDEKGFLRLQNVGGFDTRNLHARRVLVQGTEDVVGILQPSGRPVHIATDEERKKVYKVSEFYVDLFRPAEEVRKLVRVGDPVTLLQPLEVLGQAACGKALDNRLASYVAIQAVRKIAAAGSPHEIYYVATVQEEVGLRGAGPAAFGIEPDVGIAIDGTLAVDTPGVPAEEAVCTFGGGVAIKLMDGRSISDRELVDEFLRLAKRKRIKHQLEILPLGGTDAGAIQQARAGHRVITLSVPIRYVHTVCESIHTGDLQAAVDLLAAYLAS